MPIHTIHNHSRCYQQVVTSRQVSVCNGVRISHATSVAHDSRYALFFVPVTSSPKTPPITSWYFHNGHNFEQYCHGVYESITFDHELSKRSHARVSARGSHWRYLYRRTSVEQNSDTNFTISSITIEVQWGFLDTDNATTNKTDVRLSMSIT
jgi:hypothetical protein